MAGQAAALKVGMVSMFMLAAAAAVGMAQTAIPDAVSTPGATDPRVTPATLATTICAPGWSRSVRPPSTFTRALKRRQLRATGYADQHAGDYEEDHLIPLGLGGAPEDPRNLWPEPRWSIDGWGAADKDRVEDVLHRLVCSGRLPLGEAQAAIARDWRAAFRRFVGER